MRVKDILLFLIFAAWLAFIFFYQWPTNSSDMLRIWYLSAIIADGLLIILLILVSIPGKLKDWLNKYLF